MSSKTLFPCSELVKRYNKRMGGTDLKDQLTSTYRLDRRSKTRYYLCHLFDLWGMALVKSMLMQILKFCNTFVFI